MHIHLQRGLCRLQMIRERIGSQIDHLFVRLLCLEILTDIFPVPFCADADLFSEILHAHAVFVFHIDAAMQVRFFPVDQEGHGRPHAHPQRNDAASRDEDGRCGNDYFLHMITFFYLTTLRLARKAEKKAPFGSHRYALIFLTLW